MVQKGNAMIGPSLLRGVEPFRPFSALLLSLKASESFNDLYKNEDNSCSVSFVGPLQKTRLCEHVFDMVKGTELLQRSPVHHQQRRTVTTLCKIIQKTTLYFMLDFLEILETRACGSGLQVKQQQLTVGRSENKPPVNNVTVSKTTNFTVLFAVGKYHFLYGGLWADPGAAGKHLGRDLTILQATLHWSGHTELRCQGSRVRPISHGDQFLTCDLISHGCD